MSPSRLALVGFLLLFTHFGGAQQTGTTSPATASTQGAAVLQKALAALSPTPITDVTLSGTARRIAGSDDESGTVVVKALAGTGTRLDLTLPSGARSEIRNISAVPVVGSWSGPDGIAHPISYHNLLTDPGWAPAFTIASLVSAQNAVITYVGAETRDGQSVIHVTASQHSPVANDTTGLLQHLAQTDVYLHSGTFLPTSITFNIHPDNNANVDIPVEIDFSSYQAVSGAQVPLHVQRFLNKSLVLDLQFSSAILNSGISADTFTVAAGL
jgi:hypothetical protein